MTTTVDIRNAVYAAYRALTTYPGEFVSITTLRGRLTGFDQRQVTAELLRMEFAAEANLVPQANQKVLTDADLAAAVTVGLDRCLISIE